MYKRYINPREEMLKIAEKDNTSFSKKLMGKVNGCRRTGGELDICLVFCNSYHGSRYDLGDCAINDGLLVYDSLVSKGFECYVFYDAVADTCLKGVAAVLRAPCVRRVVIYFIGHGLQVGERVGNGVGKGSLKGSVNGVGKGIVNSSVNGSSSTGTNNISVIDEPDRKDEAFLFKDRVVTDDLMSEHIISNYPVNMKRRELILISDCCHSGTIFDVGTNEGYKRKNIPVISIGACMDNQTAKQDWIDRKGNGVFSHYFWKAVNGGVEEGKVIDAVNEKVRGYGMRVVVERKG
jgi:hypothetical protein